MWATSPAVKIVNKFQHCKHFFTFHIHNVNLFYIFPNVPCSLSFFVSLFFSYYESYFLTSISHWSFLRKVYSVPALMTRHMGGFLTVNCKLCHSFHPRDVNILSTFGQNSQQCLPFHFWDLETGFNSLCHSFQPPAQPHRELLARLHPSHRRHCALHQSVGWVPSY